MTNDHSPLSANNVPTPTELLKLKQRRTEFRRRRTVLRGARAYLGERAGKDLLAELETVEKQFRQIDHHIKSVEPLVNARTVDEPNIFSSTYSVPFRNRPDNAETSYVPLEEAGTLRLVYNGLTPSLHDFSRFNLALDSLVNDIAYYLIVNYLDRDLVEHPNDIYLDEAFRAHDVPLISIRIDSLRVGSFEQVLSFLIIPMLANADVRAVLQGLATNVIWVLGGGLGNAIKGSLPTPEKRLNSDIGAREYNIMMEALRSNSGPVKLHVVENRPGIGTRETFLQVGEFSQYNVLPSGVINAITPHTMGQLSDSLPKQIEPPKDT